MMVTMIEFFIGIIMATSVNSMNNVPIEANNELTEFHTSRRLSTNPREKVFQILDNKCNVCHKKRNKRRVFTSENMDTWANDIYSQVFVKKRMPKGKKIKLTAKEYQELLTWISSTKK